MKMRFEIIKASNGKYLFNLKAANEEIIFTSQLYETKAGAEEGIASVKQNAAFDGRYEEKVGTDNKPYFVLHAGNHQVIGRSQMYSSHEAMRSGIASVKRNGPAAEILDLTVHAHA